MTQYHSLIIGAGAAGLMCAAAASARGGRVLVIDHGRAAGEKIRISGGGRCNFTNLHAGPQNFISTNPHFAKSALAGYTQWDFIDLMARHGIAWHEKTLGQLFCDGSAKDVVRMLLDECAGAELRLRTDVRGIGRTESGFAVDLSDGGAVTCDTLVIATGGKSIPKMGASGYGYRVAAQFGHDLIAPRPGLVPLSFGQMFGPLAGVAVPARVSCNGATFDEAVLFTHRGLSGPAILQISSYWREGDSITLDLLPGVDGYRALRARRAAAGRKSIGTVLGELLPNRLAGHFVARLQLAGNLADYGDARLREIARGLEGWRLTPTGSEGYRTAEVTLGGVATDGLNARTMESKTVPGLYFIGEVVDVTGWLGGYNFQWAWSSGHAAGRAIAERAL